MQFHGNGPTVAESNQRRSEFLKIRLTTAERIDLDEAAVRLGKSVSEFVREAVLHQAAIVNSVDAGEVPDSGPQVVMSLAEHYRYRRFKLAELQQNRERLRVR
jgi:Mobilization protein NikA